MSVCDRLARRSVAVVVSARLGNVTSDAIEERDVCRGWKLLGTVEGPRGPLGANVACLDG